MANRMRRRLSAGEPGACLETQANCAGSGWKDGHQVEAGKQEQREVLLAQDEQKYDLVVQQVMEP